MPPFIRYPELKTVVLHNGEKIEIEMKCGTCAFGSLEETVQPCATCFRQYTTIKPYSQWAFDENYDPAEDVF